MRVETEPESELLSHINRILGQPSPKVSMRMLTSLEKAQKRLRKDQYPATKFHVTLDELDFTCLWDGNQDLYILSQKNIMHGSFNMFRYAFNATVTEELLEVIGVLHPKYDRIYDRDNVYLSENIDPIQQEYAKSVAYYSNMQPEMRARLVFNSVLDEHNEPIPYLLTDCIGWLVEFHTALRSSRITIELRILCTYSALIALWRLHNILRLAHCDISGRNILSNLNYPISYLIDVGNIMHLRKGRSAIHTEPVSTWLDPCSYIDRHSSHHGKKTDTFAIGAVIVSDTSAIECKLIDSLHIPVDSRYPDHLNSYKRFYKRRVKSLQPPVAFEELYPYLISFLNPDLKKRQTLSSLFSDPLILASIDTAMSQFIESKRSRLIDGQILMNHLQLIDVYLPYSPLRAQVHLTLPLLHMPSLASAYVLFYQYIERIRPVLRTDPHFQTLIQYYEKQDYMTVQHIPRAPLPLPSKQPLLSSIPEQEEFQDSKQELESKHHTKKLSIPRPMTAKRNPRVIPISHDQQHESDTAEEKELEIVPLLPVEKKMLSRHEPSCINSGLFRRRKRAPQKSDDKEVIRLPRSQDQAQAQSDGCCYF